MTANWLLDASFLALLIEVDLDLSAQARRSGCPACKAPLHSARYRRKGHTGPVRAPEGWDLFHGLCCSQEGCRRRVRPESVRFAGRSPNLPFQVAMVCVLRSGGAQRGVTALAALARVSERTVRRWLDFWVSACPGASARRDGLWQGSVAPSPERWRSSWRSPRFTSTTMSSRI
jgi:hypothetical protein